MAKQIVQEFQDKFFKKVDSAVSPEMIAEDKAYIMRNLRVGIELESANCSAETLQRVFGVSDYDDAEDYAETGNCVARVYRDGSISPTGAEVVFKGNSEGFEAYHRALSEVESKIKRNSHGKINNMSCSAHISLLTAQKRPLPEIYMANLYQLYRKFSDALLWLTGASNEDNYIVRSGLHRYANPLPAGSPLRNSMREIARSNGKYSGIHFKGIDWIAEGKTQGFFVEFRFIDRITSPYALTSIKCLLQAMLFKAVELSEFGILNIEADGVEGWQKTKEMVMKIENGANLSADDKTYLQQKANVLIDFISPNLRSFDGKSLSVLRALAEKPISQRYREGNRDDTIERDLAPKLKGEFKTERELRRIIQLQLVKAEKVGEWEEKVADILGVKERMIRHSLAKLGESYNIHFDKSVGGFVMVG
jgi:hypothetical protein